jgi:hypothetical protein
MDRMKTFDSLLAAGAGVGYNDKTTVRPFVSYAF